MKNPFKKKTPTTNRLADFKVMHPALQEIIDANSGNDNLSRQIVLDANKLNYSLVNKRHHEEHQKALVNKFNK